VKEEESSEGSECGAIISEGARREAGQSAECKGVHVAARLQR
jgi:hypothetical protein